MSGGHHGGGNDEFEWELDVEYDFETSVSLDAVSDLEFWSDVDVESSIDVCVDIDGNQAVFSLDVQAVGDDGATELNLQVVTTEEYSSIIVTGFSAVD